MLNHITIMGRLTRDPELRRTGSGVAVASFCVAVDRDYAPKDGGERKTDFINCVAWRQTGEFISKYFTKGRMIVVDGRLEMRDWTDKDGNKRTTAEINVDSAYFGDSKPAGTTGSAPHAAPYSAPADPYNGGAFPAPGYGTYPPPISPSQSDFALLDDDDAQLPF